MPALPRYKLTTRITSSLMNDDSSSSDQQTVYKSSQDPPSQSMRTQDPPLVKIQQPIPAAPVAPYTTQVNHVIPATAELPKKKKPKFKKVLLIILVLIFLSASGAGGFYLYNYLFNPLKLVAKSLKTIDGANSFTANATFAKSKEIGNAMLAIDYHKLPPKFSRGQVQLTNINSEPGHNLVLLFIFNSRETYLQTSYSKIDEIENQLRLIFPEILSLQTYQLTQPVFKGQKWLHFKTPETQEGFSDGKIEISKEQESQLNEKFIKSIIVRSYKRNFLKNGEKYHRIVLGFDKDTLVEFISEFKNLDLEVNIKDINSLIKIVNSVETWDEDLVIILIEKETGNLYSLSLSIPKIPEDALEKSIEESVENKDYLSYFSEFFTKKIDEFLEPSSSSELIYIGEVIFSNYNQAPSAERPAPIVESEDISQAMENDLPVILQMILFQMQQESLPPPLELKTPKFFEGSSPNILPYSETTQ